MLPADSAACLAGASLMRAQEPSHLPRIFREDIKPVEGAAHEKARWRRGMFGNSGENAGVFRGAPACG
jgi:hypothetical protein